MKKGRILLLLVLILLAWKYLDVTDAPAEPTAALQGEWRCTDSGYEDITVRIDEDMLQIFSGSTRLCSEPYAFDERTQLVTGAYRQNFELFALFEYRDGEDGANGKPVLIGSAIGSDGVVEEILFWKK